MRRVKYSELTKIVEMKLLMFWLFASKEAESIYKKMGFRVTDEMHLELD
ncbi:MAG: hypothetical protein ACOCQB_00890 [Halanaerobiaceae bacterium]